MNREANNEVVAVAVALASELEYGSGIGSRLQAEVTEAWGNQVAVGQARAGCTGGTFPLSLK